MRVLPFLCIAPTVFALSPRFTVRQYAHTAWTEAGSEPLLAVEAFVQTRDGYLALASRSTQLRFDGLRFTRWPMPAAGTARHLTVARDGAVWSATAGGLFRIDRGQVRSYPFSWGRADSVPAIAEDPRGAIWAAVDTAHGSFVQMLAPEDGTTRRYGAADGIPPAVQALAADGPVLWIASDRAVCRWTPGAKAACVPAPEGIHSLATGRDVTYAAGSRAIYRITHDRLEAVVSIAPAFGSLRRRALLADRNGNLWAGATGGLLRVRNGEVQTLSRKDGLSGEIVTGILEDAEGDIWVATNNGIDRLRNPRVLHVSTLDGLAGESTTVVKAAPDGSIWVGAAADGITRIHGRTVSRYSTADGLPGNRITAIETDRAGRVWVACGEQLAVWQNGRFRAIAGRAPRPVFSIAADASGRVWAAAGGLLRVSTKTVEAVEGRHGDVVRVFATGGGPPWLASPPSLAARLGASETLPMPKGDARAFVEDASGATWIASGALLSRFRDGKLTVWGPGEGLSAGEIHGLAIDHRSNLWLLADRAVVRVALSELASSPDAAPRAARFISYDEKDGLRLGDSAAPPYPRITTSADGRIWLCERDGLGVLDPEVLGERLSPPPVVIEQLLVDGVIHKEPDARFRGRQVQITYTANSLTAPERVRFRYRMDGSVSYWTDVQGRRELTFLDLAPGNYRFHLQACNLDDVCNEAGAVTSFVVMPFYYQTVWFKLLLSALVWSALWGGYKLRMRQVELRYRLIAQDRARVTREIHDSLLQGFAGVVLQLDAAARLFHSNPSASKERLDRALDQADEALREARQMLLDLRLPILEGRSLSEALAEVGETTTRGTPIAFSLKIRGNERPLGYTSQVAVYLIGREAIRNAVNHARPGRITATLVYEDRDCCLRVQDDGKGFDLETEGQKPGHLGVQGMRERAKEAGGRFRIETAPGAGTTVEVRVSYKGGRPALPM